MHICVHLLMKIGHWLGDWRSVFIKWIRKGIRQKEICAGSENGDSRMRPPAIKTAVERRRAQRTKKRYRWGAAFVLASSSHPASVSLPVWRPRAVESFFQALVYTNSDILLQKLYILTAIAKPTNLRSRRPHHRTPAFSSFIQTQIHSLPAELSACYARKVCRSRWFTQI